MSQKKMPHRIFICGFMGAGKTTIGKILADELSLPFFDLDEKIEEQCGMPIAAIFEKESEKKFRKMERDQIDYFIKNETGVFALGGGSLQNEQLTEHIKLNGLLIFIECPISIILQRIKSDRNRPLLLNNNGTVKKKYELHALYERRLPFYQRAEIHIDSSSYHSADRLINHLLKKIRAYASKN